jgi:hypothetical protein
MKVIIFGATRSGFSDFRSMGVPVACCEEVGKLQLGLVPLLQQGQYNQEDILAIFDERPGVVGQILRAIPATHLPKKMVVVTDTPNALRHSVQLPARFQNFVVFTDKPSDVGTYV